MSLDEKVECINCGWKGKRGEMPEEDVCPECECDGYVDIADEEFMDNPDE